MFFCCLLYSLLIFRLSNLLLVTQALSKIEGRALPVNSARPLDEPAEDNAWTFTKPEREAKRHLTLAAAAARPVCGLERGRGRALVTCSAPKQQAGPGGSWDDAPSVKRQMHLEILQFRLAPVSLELCNFRVKLRSLWTGVWSKAPGISMLTYVLQDRITINYTYVWFKFWILVANSNFLLVWARNLLLM